LFGNLFRYFSKNWAIFSESFGHPGADHKLLTEVDDTCALIVGEPKEILGEQLRPRQIS
jgi:hypothetical protein